MTAFGAAVEVVAAASLDDIDFAQLLAEQKPVVFRGLARNLPLVQAGLDSNAAAKAYLTRYDGGKPLLVFRGEAAIKGRFAYNAAVDGFNFASEHMRLNRFFQLLTEHENDVDPPSFYCGSTDMDTYLPGLTASDSLVLSGEMFQSNSVIKSIWMGNRSTACAHFDISHNLAVCVAGHRRFTLFPPDQIDNLYPGPLDPTPGGQAISMVDFTHPDLTAFPRFADAMATAQVAELEPGDVLFYPSMWWHQVEALDSFNILINYWWNTTPPFVDTPMNTLLHSLLSLRGRPEAEKAAWRAVFDYYVFGPSGTATDHLPAQAQGNLGPLDALQARKLRALILNRLNR